MPNEMETKLRDLAQETLAEWLPGHDLPDYKIIRTKGNVYEVTNSGYTSEDYLGKFKVTIHVEELA